ncbi:hypothetical protein FHS41_001366 [Streptomyces violarus]|uniref:Uncharacterized protein n=1 Tax=Streptomyces violarus TaxID=67380 RepID=A0A7W5EZW9_9ACTN|nr:hypothetical protein [Streptomyces violarus]
MTHNVLQRGHGITINLSAPDLGNPDRPGLLQEIHRNYKPDLLYCLGAHEYGTVCPGFMTIVEKNGRYHARHVTRGEVSETAGESELHKALKKPGQQRHVRIAVLHARRRHQHHQQQQPQRVHSQVPLTAAHLLPSVPARRGARRACRRPQRLRVHDRRRRIDLAALLDPDRIAQPVVQLGQQPADLPAAGEGMHPPKRRKVRR